MTRAQAERLEKRILAAGVGDVTWQWDGPNAVSLNLIFRDGARPNAVFETPADYDRWRLASPAPPTSAGTFGSALRPGDGPLAALLFGEETPE